MATVRVQIKTQKWITEAEKIVSHSQTEEEVLGCNQMLSMQEDYELGETEIK